MSLYLVLNIASFIVPFAYSFEKKMHFIRLWKSVFLSIFIVGIFFIFWDIIFTQQGVWGFNPDYHIGLNLAGLPIEEILFFVCIPYASIFTHYAFIYFFENTRFSDKLTKYISIGLLIIAIFILFYAFPKKYTTVTFSIFILLMAFSLWKNTAILSQFYITFMIILIPFFMVNGILTGSFIENEVVWYNNDENLNIRLFTIPVEDAVYAFNMLYPSLFLIAFFKKKFNKEFNF
ncbi:MAG: lycopene cyclase domain-containing protein [Flavobacteriales bacterium CG_4_10_14_0_2_um_filter_35_18]|nr:MAG: lycopene cyclase domain-containing protein [Flavobacteriales bacterium CG_4_10_14_0_2_um_filter_35_18]